MDDLHRPREGFCAARPSVLAGGEIEMPVLEEGLLAILAHVLPTICFNIKFPVLADVGKVSRHSAYFLAAAGDFDHDFRGAPYRSANLIDLLYREATRLRRTRPSAAK